MPPKPRSKSQPTNALLEALQFCSVVSEKLGAAYETHIGIRNNWAIAFNGIIAAGAPISEDIQCYPHTLLLVEALSKCDENYSLTQLDNGRLSVKSGKFKAVIPCLDPELMQNAEPDPCIAPLTNAFKDAVEAVGVLANENAQHVLTASVLMNGPSVISTNRVMLLEYWHGLDLPSNIPLPKQFVAALVKQKRDLTGFGFSKSSATFWFGNYWLRTQLYSDEWPNVSSILDRKANLWAIDLNFFKALESIEAFSIDGNVYSDTNLLMSHADHGVGAEFECTGLPKGFVYPIKQLKILKPFVKRIDWMASGVHDSSYCLVFEGDAVRGVISGRQRG